MVTVPARIAPPDRWSLRWAVSDRHDLIRLLHLLRMAGSASLAVVSLVVYFIDGHREVAYGALVMGGLSISGAFWAGRVRARQLAGSLMVDVVVLSVWVWLMGGLALAVPAVYAWVVMAAALGLGPKAAARFTLLSLAAVAALGAAHRFFDTVVFESQRQILLNLVLSAALLVPLGLLLYVIGKVQRDAETVAAQARLRLAELREMRDEFLSSVSFEMRTPLTSVKGFTATLLDSWDSFSDDERLRFLQIVNRQSDRLARLISAMVDFAQLDSGTLRLVLESINVSDLLGQVMTRTLRMHEDAEIVVEGDPDLWIGADGERVVTMLSDLIENALMHGSSPVRITARRVGDQVEVAVSDSGSGVQAPQVARLFERRSGAVSEPGAAGGLGLNLPLARELARSMGGDVTHHSDDQGATFTLSLPAAEGPPSRVEGVTIPLHLLLDFPVEAE